MDNHEPEHHRVTKIPWNSCYYCTNLKFKDLHEFSRHLRVEHCTVEGGSFVCRYGYNGVCNSLPLEGVSDLDYAEHIIKHHAFVSTSSQKGEMEVSRKRSTSSVSSNLSSSSTNLWTVSAASQNLAAVLNDPGRGKQRDFFTKTWGAEFSENYSFVPQTHPGLREITRADFEHYLRKIAKRHRRHANLNVREVTTEKGQPYLHEPLTVPNIFLQQNFDLTRPEIFFKVFPFAKDGLSKCVMDTAGKECNEKLTACLDQVEMRIAGQVAQKSEAFFQAMTSHDSLMEQLTRILTVVRKFRAKLGLVDQQTSTDGLRLVRLYRRRANYRLFLQKLKLMNTVNGTQPQIQLLLAAPDYVAALELSSTTKDILDHELQGVLSFRHLGSQLTEMDRLIDKMMACEFETYSTRDLNRPLTDNPPVLEQEKLISIMLGMLRRGNLDFIQRYESEALTAIRALVKQLALERLAESDESDQQQQNGPYFAEQAAMLPVSALIPLIQVITEQLVKLLTKIKGVHDVMQETLYSAAGLQKGMSSSQIQTSTAFFSQKDLEKGLSDLKKLLESVCNFSHDESAKLLAHTDALNNSSAREVCALSSLVDGFHSETLKLCGHSATPLRFAFSAQAGNFVKRFHLERKERLSVELDAESWRAATVPETYQVWLASLIENGKFEEVDFERESDMFQNLTLNGEKFIVIGSTLTVLRLISEYVKLARKLPVLTHKIGRNLEELLNFFNSRCCALVLGAGAIKKDGKDGRKTITTTNLALTARNLQLLVLILPFIRKYFEGRSEENGKSAQLSNFLTSLESNMNDHINQLRTKVVFIVNSSIKMEIKSWKAKPPVPSQVIRNILKYLTKLYEAVADVLPAKQVEKLYKEINETFKSSLREQISALNIINDGGPQHGTVTSELIFYSEMLKKLNVLPLEDLCENSLNDIWPPR